MTVSVVVTVMVMAILVASPVRCVPVLERRAMRQEIWPCLPPYIFIQMNRARGSSSSLHAIQPLPPQFNEVVAPSKARSS